jgi:hypothetical protein
MGGMCTTCVHRDTLGASPKAFAQSWCARGSYIVLRVLTRTVGRQENVSVPA